MDKTCTKCNVARPATREFFGSTPSGNLRGECRACIRQKNKRYASKNPQSVIKRARTRKSHTCGWKPSNELKQSLFERQSGLCGLCNDVMNLDDVLDPTHLQVEHLTPASKGGTNDESNLVLAHRKCNQEKAGKTLEEYIAWRKLVGLPSIK